MARSISRWSAFLAIPLLGGSAWWFMGRGKADEAALVATVKQGEFKALVSVSGELRAQKFVEITGPKIPMQIMQAGLYGLSISRIVPEGTIVKKGDFVAELDRTSAAPVLETISTAKERASTEYTQAILDTTLSLATAREEIRTIEASLEEKRIAVEQSIYEAPSVQRQAKLDYEKTKHQLEQAKLNFVTKKKQAGEKVKTARDEMTMHANRLAAVNEIVQGFTIYAPDDGMVIYDRGWDGRKKGVGAQLGGWERTVATLPDMSQMQSTCYVTEVDIAKVAPKQKVTITLDADPTKSYPGEVLTVANVGEQRANTDSKVFEVTIKLNGEDMSLRPGMTTRNVIETAAIANALSIPIESVMNGEGVSFVYKKKGRHVIRQQVELGMMGENEVVVLKGLEAGDEILLNAPAKGLELPLVKIP